MFVESRCARHFCPLLSPFPCFDKIRSAVFNFVSLVGLDFVSVRPQKRKVLGDGVSLETIHLITRERLEAHPRVDDFSAPNVAAYPERVSALTPNE